MKSFRGVCVFNYLFISVTLYMCIRVSMHACMHAHKTLQIHAVYILLKIFLYLHIACELIYTERRISDQEILIYIYIYMIKFLNFHFQISLISSPLRIGKIVVSSTLFKLIIKQ